MQVNSVKCNSRENGFTRGVVVSVSLVTGSKWFQV